MSHDFTKAEYAALIRRTIGQAEQHKGTHYGAFLAWRAACMTTHLRRRIYADRLMALVVRFPQRISFGV